MKNNTGNTGQEVDRVTNRTAHRYCNSTTPARRNSSFTPAARAFGTLAPRMIEEDQPQVVDARYVGNIIEYRIKKVLRSEYGSLVIVLLIMLGVFSVLFLMALLLGWF